MISYSPVWFGNEKIYGERKRKKKEEKSKMDIFYIERARERKLCSRYWRGKVSGAQELINIGWPVTQISFVHIRRDLGRVCPACHLLNRLVV